jgi:hypothetical protein
MNPGKLDTKTLRRHPIRSKCVVESGMPRCRDAPDDGTRSDSP